MVCFPRVFSALIARIPASVLVPVVLASFLGAASGCAKGDAVWAVQSASVVPGASGLTGTQAWTFFDKRWGKAKDDGAFVCARSQIITGAVTTPLPGCADCTVAYDLEVQEIGTDCDASLGEDASYTLPLAMAIGPVDDSLSAVDPHAGRSLGWYASFDGESLTPYGLAWDAAFDSGGEPGPPGWNPSQTYTLWSAFAWDLASTGSEG